LEIKLLSSALRTPCILQSQEAFTQEYLHIRSNRDVFSDNTDDIFAAA